MAGLPVLLMGFNAALTALIALSQTTPDLTLAAWCAAISLALFVVAFRIRAEKSGWTPLAVGLFAAFLVISVSSASIALKRVGVIEISSIQIVTGWIVPLICTILVVAGFKGWLWLRENDVRRPL